MNRTSQPTLDLVNESRTSIRLLLLVLLAALLPYLPTLRNGFAFDDHALMENSPAVAASTPVPSWTLPYWPDQRDAALYRPWTTMSFWLDHRLFGLPPVAYHATNLLLHAAVCVLVLLLLRRLFPGRTAATTAAALLFAVHPIHSEAVVAIVGRAELWAALGALAAYLAALRASDAPPGARVRWLVLSTLCLAIGLFSKESALGMIGLAVLHAMFERSGALPKTASDGPVPARFWLSVAALWLIPLLLLFALRLKVLGALFGLANVSTMDNSLLQIATGPRVAAALGFQWLVLGLYLFPRHLSADYSFPQLVPTTGWQLAGVGFGLLALVTLWAVWRRRDVPLLWCAAFLLATGILTSNIVVPIGTIMGERLAYLPSVGALFRLNRVEEAVPHLRRAAYAQPIGRKNLEEALELGNAYVSLRRGAEAESAFSLAARVAGEDVRWRIGHASALAVAQRWPESARAWGAAVRLSPKETAVRRQWAFALWQSGAIDSAEVIYVDLTREAPSDPDVLNDAAWFLGRTSRRPGEALSLARRAFAARPDGNDADTLLRALLASRGETAARAWIDSLEGVGVAQAIIDELKATAEAHARSGEGDEGDE